MNFEILRPMAKELKKAPQALKESVFGALERLSRGEKIPMPLCKSLPAIARGLYELRFSYKAGEYRLFYYIKVGDAIYIIHAMKKKTQKIEQKVIDLLKKRIRGLS